MVKINTIGYPLIEKTLLATVGEPWSIRIPFMRSNGNPAYFNGPDILRVGLLLCGDGYLYDYQLCNGIKIIDANTIEITGCIDKLANFDYKLFFDHDDDQSTLLAEGFFSVIQKAELSHMEQLIIQANRNSN